MGYHIKWKITNQEEVKKFTILLVGGRFCNVIMLTVTTRTAFNQKKVTAAWLQRWDTGNENN